MFWLPLLALLSLVAWEIIVLGRRDATPIVFLVVSASLIGMLVTPELFQLFGYDAYSEVSVAQSIVDGGRWNPTLGYGFATNYYGYYPSLHLVFSSVALVTGIPVLTVFKYVVPLTVSLSVFAAAYLMFKRSFSIANPALASLIYVSSLGFMALAPSRRATALVFGALVIALLFWEPRNLREERSRTITTTILLGALAFSDHFMGPVVLISTIFYLIIVRILKSRSVTRSVLVPLLGGLLYGGWLVFTASYILGLDIARYRIFFVNLLRPEIPAGNPLGMYGYIALEKGVVLLSYGSFGLLALIGLILLIWRREDRRWIVWGAIGIIMFGASTVMALNPNYGVISITLSWFATMLLSVLASLTVVKLSAWLRENPAKVVTVFLIVIMFSGAMLAVYGARTLNRSPKEACSVEEIREYSSDQYALGKWMKTYSEPGSSVLGDFGSYALLSALYGIKFGQHFIWPGQPPQPDEFNGTFVLEGKNYLACRSLQWGNTDATLVESLGSLNRLWDGGTWWLLCAPSG